MVGLGCGAIVRRSNNLQPLVERGPGHAHPVNSDIHGLAVLHRARHRSGGPQEHHADVTTDPSVHSGSPGNLPGPVLQVAHQVVVHATRRGPLLISDLEEGPGPAPHGARSGSVVQAQLLAVTGGGHILVLAEDIPEVLGGGVTAGGAEAGPGVGQIRGASTVGVVEAPSGGPGIRHLCNHSDTVGAYCVHIQCHGAAGQPLVVGGHDQGRSPVVRVLEDLDGVHTAVPRRRPHHQLNPRLVRLAELAVGPPLSESEGIVGDSVQPVPIDGQGGGMLREIRGGGHVSLVDGQGGVAGAVAAEHLDIPHPPPVRDVSPVGHPHGNGLTLPHHFSTRGPISGIPRVTFAGVGPQSVHAPGVGIASGNEITALPVTAGGGVTLVEVLGHGISEGAHWEIRGILESEPPILA
mmetsp:Transcript_35433/g.81168  ORF Transcript_35433/g.81168 Transcript_35433/m.81168 type:complete len:408 (-) Transcript_35433:1000-2223(-)